MGSDEENTGYDGLAERIATDAETADLGDHFTELVGDNLGYVERTGNWQGSLHSLHDATWVGLHLVRLSVMA